MIKNLLFVCCFVAGMLFASAQERKDLKINACGTDALHLKLLKEDADYKEKFDKNNALWQEWAPKQAAVRNVKNTKKGSNLSTSAWVGPPVILNIVFHNMHNPILDTQSSTVPIAYPVTYPDYAAIVADLNSIYNGNNPNGSTGIVTGVQFCLATEDVFGNPYVGSTSGPNPTLHNTGLTEIDNTDIDNITAIVNASNTLSLFPRTKYINVYIVDDIKGDHPAFSFLPPSHGKPYDGIYIERDQFFGNNLIQKRTTLAHEMGHYLGLLHTFGICDPDQLLNLPITDTTTADECSCENANCLFNGDCVYDFRFGAWRNLHHRLHARIPTPLREYKSSFYSTAF